MTEAELANASIMLELGYGWVHGLIILFCLLLGRFEVFHNTNIRGKKYSDLNNALYGHPASDAGQLLVCLTGHSEDLGGHMQGLVQAPPCLETHAFRMFKNNLGLLVVAESGRNQTHKGLS